MNIQEVIELLENNTYRLFGSENEGVPLEIAIRAVRLINKPAKVVVPKVVAGWIEYCKEHNFGLAGAFSRVVDYKSLPPVELPAKVHEYVQWTLANEEIFARAWLDGYEVE